jgi:hypothetical protein
MFIIGTIGKTLALSAIGLGIIGLLVFGYNAQYVITVLQGNMDTLTHIYAIESLAGLVVYGLSVFIALIGIGIHAGTRRGGN